MNKTFNKHENKSNFKQKLHNFIHFYPPLPGFSPLSSQICNVHQKCVNDVKIHKNFVTIFFLSLINFNKSIVQKNLASFRK